MDRRVKSPAPALTTDECSIRLRELESEVERLSGVLVGLQEERDVIAEARDWQKEHALKLEAEVASLRAALERISDPMLPGEWTYMERDQRSCESFAL
jgi:hypothetical protein